MAAIRPNAGPALANHVVVETVDGQTHRLLLVPPRDVEVLRGLRRASSAASDAAG